MERTTTPIILSIVDKNCCPTVLEDMGKNELDAHQSSQIMKWMYVQENERFQALKVSEIAIFGYFSPSCFQKWEWLTVTSSCTLSQCSAHKMANHVHFT